jgi:hypothetical protein
MYAYILPFDGYGRFHPLLGRPICMKFPVTDKQSIRSLVDIYIKFYVEHRINVNVESCEDVEGLWQMRVRSVWNFAAKNI